VIVKVGAAVGVFVSVGWVVGVTDCVRGLHAAINKTKTIGIINILVFIFFSSLQINFLCPAGYFEA
jgi:hypothetical protein